MCRADDTDMEIAGASKTGATAASESADCMLELLIGGAGGSFSGLWTADAVDLIYWSSSGIPPGGKTGVKRFVNGTGIAALLGEPTSTLVTIAEFLEGSAEMSTGVIAGE